MLFAARPALRFSAVRGIQCGFPDASPRSEHDLATLSQVGAVLDHHPTIVNLRSNSGDDRSSLVELAIEQGGSSRLLERLLEVCKRCD